MNTKTLLCLLFLLYWIDLCDLMLMMLSHFGFGAYVSSIYYITLGREYLLCGQCLEIYIDKIP